MYETQRIDNVDITCSFLERSLLPFYERLQRSRDVVLSYSLKNESIES
jgi:hypothetical protein